MNNWLSGISYEVAFWEATLTNRKERAALQRFSHRGGEISLNGFDAPAFLRNLPSPTQAIVLDVGCGMSYAPGDKLRINGSQEPINIHYVDPLADYFNHIIRRHKLDLPEVEFGMMEYIGAFYPEHNVSLIIIQNALDHSANPVKGILESLTALHTDGVLYLNHHPNEAEFENYRGFHQFNITIEEGHLVIWNRLERHDINSLLEGFAQVSAYIVDNNPVAVIRKTDEVPAKLLDYRHDTARLCRALLDYSMIANSSSYMLRYHLRFFFYRTSQALSKLLPWQTRQQIKRFYNKLFGKR
ncbi:MAG: hypothetical protein IJ169_00840 [Paludibacteraceae bacterium]|nr:hypothetical protein [Paludibacteraceae bacterium]